jgi:hypothetical protein
MKALSFAIILALGMFASHAAEAQRARPHGFGGEKFEANKKFGLGLELGEPTGITGKLFVSPDQALDFGIGDLYHGYYINANAGGIHLYADYLWHPFVLTKTEAFYLPFYVGVGGRFWNTDYCDRVSGACASLFGVRVPVGISFDFNNVPLDIFVQLVPTLDFYRNYTPHSVYLDIDFSFGVRFWFS